MTEKTLNDLFLAQLKDIYFAEKQIYKTLPKMAKATRLPELKEAFTAHREQTHGHIERLEEVFEMMGKRSGTRPCETIKGIISEGEETIEDFGQSPAIDTGILLNETLQEEVKADKLLTQIGATKADKKAA